MEYIIPNGWILTLVFGYQKWLLFQLCHNHYSSYSVLKKPPSLVNKSQMARDSQSECFISEKL